MAGGGVIRGVILVVLIGALAGCVGGQPAQTVETEAVLQAPGGAAVQANLTFVTNVERTLNATLGAKEATMQDWFLASMPAGPDRPVAGFSWRVPPGAVVPTDWDSSVTTIALEVAPVYPPGAESLVTQYILSSFVLDSGQAVLTNQYSRGTWDEVYRTGPLVESFHYPYSGKDGGYFWLCCDRFKAGDTIYFVLAAEAERPTEMGLAFRAINHDPDTSKEFAPKDFIAFQSNVTGRTPQALERLGTGLGFSFPVYVDVRGLFVYGYEGWTKDVVFRDNLPLNPRPMVTGRDFQAEFNLPTARGFGWGVGGYWGGGANGKWDTRLSIHGPEQEVKGTIAPAYLGNAVSSYWDGSGYITQGEGDGPSTAKFHLTVADTSDTDVIYFVHLDFGATLKELIGHPAKQAAIPWGPTGYMAAQGFVRGSQIFLPSGDGSWTVLPMAAGAGHQAARPLLAP